MPESGWADAELRTMPDVPAILKPRDIGGECSAESLRDPLPPITKLEKWDRRFLELAKTISTWSKDPSTQVGAVLVNHRSHVVGVGYNGFPRGVIDEEWRYSEREVKYALICHAEVNAILQAGHESRGAVLYTYPSFMLPPICSDCAKVAIQAGVIGIVGYEPDLSDERVQRWSDSISVAKQMWDEVGLFIRSYKEV